MQATTELESPDVGATICGSILGKFRGKLARPAIHHRYQTFRLALLVAGDTLYDSTTAVPLPLLLNLYCMQDLILLRQLLSRRGAAAIRKRPFRRRQHPELTP